MEIRETAPRRHQFQFQRVLPSPPLLKQRREKLIHLVLPTTRALVEMTVFA